MRAIRKHLVDAGAILALVAVAAVVAVVILANQRLTLFGLICYPDILFADAGLIIEFDGYVVHSSKGAFESDRHRQNQLVLAGYRVLRFTWQQLKDDPAAVVREIRAALAQGEPVIC